MSNFSFLTGMNNSETLQMVERGYRMSQPSDCPDQIYDVMLKTWDTMPENRPTFEFLSTFFDDYFSATESSYKPAAPPSSGSATPHDLASMRLQACTV